MSLNIGLKEKKNGETNPEKINGTSPEKGGGVRKHSLRMENCPGSLNVILCNDTAGEADREETGGSVPASAGSDFCFSINSHLALFIWTAPVCRGNWTCWTISTFACNLGRAGVGRERAECFRRDVLQGIFLLVTFSTPALGSSANSDTLQRTNSPREARQAMLILGSRWCPCFCRRTLASFFTFGDGGSQKRCLVYCTLRKREMTAAVGMLFHARHVMSMWT